MGIHPPGRLAGRRRLFSTGLIASVLGLLQPVRTARAANGDPAILGQTNTATTTTELTDKVPDQPVLVVRADPSENSARTALEANGGGPSGYGAVALGGPAGDHDVGGKALWATGGHGDGATSGTGGTGLVATGGGSGTGTGGDGGNVYGGLADKYPGVGTWVAVQYHSDEDGTRGSGAPGVSSGGSGVCGVLAVGTSGRTFGAGLLAMGGTLGPDTDEPGGEGLIATGGVLGETAAPWKAGILANHNEGAALHGLSTTETDPGLGMHGLSENSYGGLFTSAEGVGASAGVGGALTGPAVEGASTAGYGAFGICDDGSALFAASMTGVGIVGSSVNGNGGYFASAVADQAAAHVNHTAATASNLAPIGVIVNGDLIVENGIKSAAVPTSQGLALLYAVEGPVAMLEDVGTVRLAGGRGRVDLDPILLEIIDPRELFIFLSPRGATASVYVANQDARGFEVREQQGGTGTFDVSYRVAARRKGLADGHRLAPFTRPQRPARPAVELTQLAAVPPIPLANHPKRPDPTRGRGQAETRNGGSR